jgi:nucleoside phosphorylase
LDRLDQILKELSERERTRIGKADAPGNETQAEAPSAAVPARKDQREAAHAEDSPDSRADIAILVALPEPELTFVLKTFSQSWRQEGRDGIVFQVGTMPVSGTELTVVAAAQNDMGMVPASILATKTISSWRPSFVAMVGICAGVKEKVELGDVVVGQQFFDYGSGKLNDGRLVPDYTPVPLNDHVCALAKTLALDTELSARVRGAWGGSKAGKPATELTVHVGPMASGAAVVADNKIVEDIEQHKRSLLAVDMESYGLARAVTSAIISPHFMIVKGVQDFADPEKNDNFREYAALVSAVWLYEFIQRSWNALFR